MTTKIIPCYHYKDLNDMSKPGISRFTSYVPPGYVLVQSGFTTDNEDGTQGCGRVPFKSRAEGEAWLAAFKARTGRDFEGMAGFTS